MSSGPKPTLALSLGDPAGIGPEIALKAVKHSSIRDRGNLLIVGSVAVLEECARRIGWKGKIRGVESLVEANFSQRDLQVLDPGPGSVEFVPGEVGEGAGKMALAAIEAAMDLCLSGGCDGMVTGPVNKVALRLAGCPVPGHTEILADRAGVQHPMTLFLAGPLRIFFFSRHLSLLDAIRAIDRQSLVEFLVRVDVGMKQMGFREPRIGVAALNPHGSDGGLMGREEIEEIEPAIEEARERGIQAIGPIPADSIFGQIVAASAKGGEGALDCQVALYHDQGHIAAKTLDFHGTVSVTLGLPFVRTSVDHGTAFDIAWQGKASETSLVKAVESCLDLVGERGDRDPVRP